MYCPIIRSSAAVRTGAVRDGHEVLQKYLDQCESVGARWMRPLLSSELALSYAMVGATDHAFTLLREIREYSESSGDTCAWGLVDLVEADILMGTGAWREAVEVLATVIAESGKQDLWGLQLRAMIALARIRRQQGLAADVDGSLASLYSSLKGDFESVDLREAEAVLAG